MSSLRVVSTSFCQIITHNMHIMFSTDQRQGIMRLRLKRGATAVVTNRYRVSASLEPRPPRRFVLAQASRAWHRHYCKTACATVTHNCSCSCVRVITLGAHAQRGYGSWVCVRVSLTSHFSNVCLSHKRYDLPNGQ